MSTYIADEQRYEKMKYFKCGNSGLKLPGVSLGFWHNFGGINTFENSRAVVRAAFDAGICHFDLANNYGPPPGSAEETFGQILKKDLAPYRDEIIISTKAGYRMWDGLYGDGGSRKYLIASLDQSLKRMGLDYVDIFYHHCPDEETPIEESMYALAQIVKQGKALYVGVPSYGPEATLKAYELLKEQGVRLLIHQPNYSMFNRYIENGLTDIFEKLGIGCIAYCPLSQGLLTDRYKNGIPEDSRAKRIGGYFENEALNPDRINKVAKLAKIAEKRNQTVAQLALAWVVRGGKVTSALIGASRPEQVIENAKAMDNTDFSKEELDQIEEILAN